MEDIAIVQESDERGHPIWRWRSAYTISEEFDSPVSCAADARRRGLEISTESLVSAVQGDFVAAYRREQQQQLIDVPTYNRERNV